MKNYETLKYGYEESFESYKRLKNLSNMMYRNMVEEMISYISEQCSSRGLYLLSVERPETEFLESDLVCDVSGTRVSFSFNNTTKSTCKNIRKKLNNVQRSVYPYLAIGGSLLLRARDEGKLTLDIGSVGYKLNNTVLAN